MMNPDGVVIGNARSSLAGVDLNRRWTAPNAVMHPEIYFLKVHMKRVANKGFLFFVIFMDTTNNSTASSTVATKLLMKAFFLGRKLVFFQKFSHRKSLSLTFSTASFLNRSLSILRLV